MVRELINDGIRCLHKLEARNFIECLVFGIYLVHLFPDLRIQGDKLHTRFKERSLVAKQWRNFHVVKGANAGQIFLTAPFAPSKNFKI